MTKTITKSKALLYIKVGEITSTHGLAGGVFINTSVSVTKDLVSKLTQKSVQIRKNSTLLFDGFLKSVRSHKKGLIIQTGVMHNPLEAQAFKGAHLWVKRDLFISRTSEAIYLSEILGFAVYDKNRGFIGYVSSFSDNGTQDILVVKNRTSRSGVDVLFIPEFVMHIDFKKSSLFLDLPINWPGF